MLNFLNNEYGVLIMTECIFCQIIEGSIPSAKIYEDEHVYAFMDIMPLYKRTSSDYSKKSY